MNRAERERLVDSLLDRTLGPQLVEPRAGMEERILANLPKEVEWRPWWQWMWIPAVAAAAVLAIVIGLQLLHHERPAPQIVKKAVDVPNTEATAETHVPARHVVERPRQTARRATPRVRSLPATTVARAEPLPRQDVFPAPVPMTEQERLLLAFVNHQRPQAELVAAEQQSEREKAQKYFETGEAPVATPIPAQPMR